MIIIKLQYTHKLNLLQALGSFYSLAIVEIAQGEKEK